MTAGNLFVTNGTTKIADRSTASFSQSGGNAAFADLRIGDLGLGTYDLSGGQMLVTPRTTNDFLIVGNLENGVLNQSGGVAIIGAELHLADNPGITGDVHISGGQFFATNDLVAIGRYGLGSLTVSNATAVLTNVSVGRHGTGEGTLLVQSNANVWLISDLSIGRLVSATGHVLVEGGLLSLTNDTIWVGRDGNGDFTVSGGTVRAKELFIAKSEYGTNTPAASAAFNGGVVIVSSNCVIGSSLISTGSMSIAGGNVYVTNATGTANLSINQGALTLSGGILAVDTLTLTTNTGQFVFVSGTMRARSMNVSNGAPFVIGDGVNPATLVLQGGTYSFADGLVISPNATVTGCGTVVGPITNNGVYANSCGASVTISSITRIASTATINFSTITGSNHILEYKTNLTAPAWNAILPGVIGNGNTMSKADPNATNTTRFYRVSVQ
jgi:T5SS/PEP-CTERM-associated repeat protein